MNTEATNKPDLFKIGHVAEQTGISVPLLRVWERRYGCEPTERINTHRYYSKEQVERIKKIKELSDQGYPLAQLFELSDDEIDNRLTEERVATTSNIEEKINVILVGRELFSNFDSSDNEQLEEVDRFSSFEAFRQAGLDYDAQLDDADMIVLYQPAVKQDQLELLRGKTSKPILLVCRYVNQDQLLELRLQNIDVSTHLDWYRIAESATELMKRQPSRSTATVPQCKLEANELEILERSEKDAIIRGRDIVSLLDQLRSFEEHLYIGATTNLHREVAEHITSARVCLEDAATEMIQAQSLLIES